MEIENKVSIWTGKFNSEDEFNKYLKETYNEDGGLLPSIFMNDFEIEHIDHDLQENEYFDGMLTKDDLLGFSYDETFIDKIDEKLLIGNCIILVYDFEYSGKIKTKNNVNFIGTYDYKKD